MKNLTIYIAIAILVIAAIVAFFIINNSESTPVVPTEGPIVAIVNGQEITREEFNDRVEEAKSAITAQGQAAQLENPEILAQIESQVFEQMINTVLVLQEIEKEGIVVPDEVLAQEYQAIIDQIGSAEEFAAELVKADITEEEFQTNIKNQLLTQRYLESKISQEDIAVTDEEVLALYNQSIEGQENVPTFEEVEDQVRNQAIQTKSNQLIDALIQSLRAGSEIKDLRQA